MIEDGEARFRGPKAVYIACSRRSDSGERCEVKKSAKKLKRGRRRGERGSQVPAPLSLVPLYFSSLSLLRTALHYLNSLQCRRILGGRNLVRVRNVVVSAIFDFMTVEDWGE